MKRMLLLSGLLLLCLAAAASAMVPRTINYQGVLTDGAGVAVPDGPYNVTFRIYDVATGGSPLWEELRTVQVSKGTFSIVLGKATPIDLEFYEGYWLAMQVYANPELTPRVELTTVPYAMTAGAVHGANLFAETGDVGIGTSIPNTDLHIKNDTDGGVGIRIENDDTGSSSREYLIFRDENGDVAGIGAYDDGAGAYAASMALWNNRPGGNILFRTGALNRMKLVESGDLGVGVMTPAERLDVDGAIRLGTTANTNAGTIRWTGSDFEGYDGAAWHSLTATGGGSLPAGIAGQTIRHNGSAWVSSSNIYNNGTAVGIGTQAPGTELHVYGGGDVVSIDGPAGGQSTLRFMTEGTQKWGFYVPSGDDDFALWHYRTPTIANYLFFDASTGHTGVMKTDPEYTLDVNGSIRAADTLLAQNVELDSDTQSQMILRLGGDAQARLETSIYGGNLDLFDDTGNYMAGIEADVSGEGGYFYVRRSTGSNGFMIDGNYSAMNETRVSITGSSSSYFRTDQTGDGSVILPAGAISDTEILDEPGAASYTEGLSSVTLTGDPTTIGIQSITCPTSGYVLAIGTCQGRSSHTTGTSSSAQFGVSTDATLPENQDVGFYFPSGNPSGTYDIPVTVHGLFEVTAGSHDFYLLGQSLAGTHYAFDRQLTLVFLPTSYGTIEPTVAGANVPDDQAPVKSIPAGDAASIHAASAAANDARIEDELAALRARVEELERDRDDNRR